MPKETKRLFIFVFVFFCLLPQQVLEEYFIVRLFGDACLQ
jgi:hypothetical protein